jgi:5'-methylthioadenosine phosphorylase
MADKKETIVGVIGGSGVYDIDGLTNVRWEKVTTPFGEPSDDLMFGELDGQKVVFLPRHGRGHITPPTELNYRANIYALKQAGVTDIVSVSAVGSFKEELPPGTFVIVDQYVDRTYRRINSFFTAGLVGHISMAHPVCDRIGDAIEEAAKEIKVNYQRGGTYVVIEGPHFSTYAESTLFKSQGADVIGMTNQPEAKLAREAEMCYGAIAMVTDFDCWHPDHDNVTAASVVACAQKNAVNARELVRHVIPKLAGHNKDCVKGCHTALDGAIQTAPEGRSEKTIKELGILVERVLK